jgi:hypothetical protein
MFQPFEVARKRPAELYGGDVSDTLAVRQMLVAGRTAWCERRFASEAREMTMGLRVVGAGVPRTGTSSLRQALEHLFGGRCCHMSALPGHPFDLGEAWDEALSGAAADWDRLLGGFNAAVDWPASLFWRELGALNPEALVILSVRENPEAWLQSLSATVLPVARRAQEGDWKQGRHLVAMFERFAGTDRWDDPATLMDAYERHNAQVRRTVPRRRFLEWRATDGWGPLCRALRVAVPAIPFPWTNRRYDWR